LPTGVQKCKFSLSKPILSNIKMRWLLAALFLTLGLVQALSSGGNRLLVVIEEAAEKSKYSTFWGDLEGSSNDIASPEVH